MLTLENQDNPKRKKWERKTKGYKKVVKDTKTLQANLDKEFMRLLWKGLKK